MAEVGYVMLGTNVLTRAVAFYDAILGGLVLCASSKPIEASPGRLVQTGNRSTPAHSRALELGATDEGKPGPRGDAGSYAAYFRDLDGNELNVFCVEQTASAG